MSRTITPFCFRSTRYWESLSPAIKGHRIPPVTTRIGRGVGVNQGCSSFRGLARMSTTDQHATDNSSCPPSQPPPKRRYRPGYNSYLKVLLEDTIVTALYEATLELRDYCVMAHASTTTATASSAQHEGGETTHRDGSTTDHVDDNVATTGRGSLPSPQGGGIKLKPRSLTSLHLTLLFGGEVWGEIPAEELEQFQARISHRLARSGFSPLRSSHHDDTNPPSSLQETMQQLLPSPTNTATNDRSSSQQNEDDHGRTEDEYWIRFDRLTIFPPRRNNLVVALFQVSPAWQALYKDLVATLTTTNQQPSSADKEDALQQIAKKSHNTWAPHVTLANIIVQGKERGSHMQALKKQLDQTSQALTNKLGSSSNLRGISMGGPVPSQVALNWDFASPLEWSGSSSKLNYRKEEKE
eukprot:scaffold896_cov172-Amphora_coffeaeformis.AAC.17